MKKFLNLVCLLLKQHRKKLIVMRNTVLILLISALQVFATGSYAQTKKISLAMNDASIREVLYAIQKQSEFYFLYNSELIDVTKKVDITIEEEKVDEILTRLFNKNEVDFLIKDRYIVLTPVGGNAELFDQRTVSGTVTDESGLPLPGVTVLIKGTTQGTVTNADGNYSLSNIPEDATLVFSFVGMRTQEIIVGGKTTINVALEEETIGIEEVVAVGYGTQKKSDLTGSVSSITNASIEGKSMSSLEQGIQGKAAGVRVMQTSSEPGGEISVRIRGGNSINAGNEPLYVVDGFIGVGDLNTINSNDIESIEILKDASATALYGARGANGVVLISTKRGKAGQTKFQFSGYYGSQQIAKTLPLMEGDDFAMLANEAAFNTGQPAPYPNLAEVVNTNWQEEIFRVAPVQNYNLSATGGTNIFKYAISSEYFDQKGILLNSGFNRYSFRANFDLKISERLKFASFITASRTRKANSAETGDEFSPIRFALFSSPADPVYLSTGEYNFDTNIGDGILYNPVAQVKESVNDNYNNRILSNMVLQYNLTKGLIIKSSVGIDLISGKTNIYYPKTTFVGRKENSIASISDINSLNIINENLLTYSAIFNDHSIDLLGGFTIQKYESEFFSASSKNYALDLLTYNDLSAGSVYLTPTSGADAFQLVSFLLRANYTYNNKYLLTFSGRYDGSSKFGANNKYAFFPSAAFAWRMSDEDFISSLNLFSNLKFRFSYGKLGSQEIPSYQALAAMISRNVPFSGSPNVGYTQSRLSNPDLKWETTSQSDMGLDIGFFRNRLNFTADLYHKVTDNLLLVKDIPSTSGFSTSFENIGSLENKGLELDVKGVVLDGKRKWTSDFNIAFNKNKVLDLGDKDFIYAGAVASGQKLGTSGLIEVGKEIGQIVGYKTDGIYQTQEEVNASAEKAYAKPGYLRIKDINDDKKIDVLDRVVLGSANPKFFWGFTNNFSYENWNLDFLFTGSYGNRLINYNAFNLSDPSGLNNVYAELKNRWNGPESSNTHPVAGGIVQKYIYDFYVEDASYIRLKYITLSWNVNDEWVKNLHLSNVKFYLTAQNLFTITQYRGFDPETSIGGKSTVAFGGDFNAFPSARQVIFGINIGF
jgi:TonB-linked SusC/RagA family outer membrane protein